ncbi:MAG: DNA-3-methyladenine glycosylase family protein [Candidatus Binataceae bacterium]
MVAKAPALPFDLAEAMRSLAERDEQLRVLIDETMPFQLDIAEATSPYEALLESIAYQSISGKAAATIFGRVKALGSNGRAPTPKQMLKLRKPVLRKAGLSAAKILAMKDLAHKTIAGVVPTLAQAHTMSDEELVERLVSVRGIGAWSVEMFLIFRPGPPRRAAHPRPRRKERMVGSLRQEAHARAPRAAGLRRTMAPVAHGRELVHVARLRTRGLRGNQQNPPRQTPEENEAHPSRRASIGPARGQGLGSWRGGSRA